MKSDPVTMTIQDLVEMDSQEALQVDPEYQRGAEWTVKQERLLIDSLFRGYTIPLFYFHKRTTKGKWAENTYYYIVDGQQRKNAIIQYVKNQFSMFDPAKDAKTGLAHFQKGQPVPWAGKAFDALPDALRQQFLGIPLQVIMVETNDDNEVRDLFIRLQAGLPLSAQEKRDAWPGDFTKFIIETAGKVSNTQKWMGHDFFRKVLKGSVARGNMRKLCASMFMQFYSRRANKYAPDSFTSLNALDIDNFYQYHIDFNSNAEESCAPRFREILDEAVRLLGDGKRPKIEANMAYNVVLMLDILAGNFAPAWRARFTEAFDRFQASLTKARKSKDPKDEFWIGYGVLTGVSASSKGRIEERYRFFERKILEAMSPLARLDSKRAYTPAERELVFYRDRSVCQKCKAAVNWADVEIDHITPYAVGGETSLENARLVHRACHARGVNALAGFTDSGAEVATSKPWEEDVPSGTKRMVLDGTGRRVRIEDLASAGLLVDGCKLVFPMKNGAIEARFVAPNGYVFQDESGAHPYSSFSSLIAEKIGPRNVWVKTEVEFPNGEVIALEELRERYLESSEAVEDEEEEDEE